jgi:hypothetical protein
VKIDSFALVLGKLSEPMMGPLVQGVEGVVSRHSVQLTVPVGGPPTELPATVAVSPQVLPTALSLGGTIDVVKPGVAAVTPKHSALEGVPETLSLEPV